MKNLLKSPEGGALRRYSLNELDRMRHALSYIHAQRYEGAEYQHYSRMRVEEELRTIMFAGIEPAELEAKAEDVKLQREEAFRLWRKNLEEELLRDEYGPRKAHP